MLDFRPFRPSNDNFGSIIISKQAEANFACTSILFCLDVTLLSLLFIINFQTWGKNIPERKYRFLKNPP